MRYVFILLIFLISVNAEYRCDKDPVSQSMAYQACAEFGKVPNFYDVPPECTYYTSDSLPPGTILLDGSTVYYTDCEYDYNPRYNTCTKVRYYLSYPACIDDPNPCMNTNPPDTYNDLPYVLDFSEQIECVNYAITNNVDKAVCVENNKLPTYNPGDCPRWYLYGDSTNPCTSYTPPLTYNGYTYQGKYPSLEICVDAVQFFGGGNGHCILAEPCTYAFGYWNSNTDTNITNPGDYNNSTDLPNGPLPPDSDLGSPDQIDDNNDSFDLNPLLDQISQASDRNHNDLDRLTDQLLSQTDRIDSSINEGISDLIDSLSDLQKGVSGLSGNIDDVKNAIDSKDLNFTFDTSGIEQRLDALNTDQGPTLPDDTSIDDFITNFQTQFSSIQNSLENAKNILTGGVPNISLPAGSDPSVSGTVMGKQVTFSSCETLQSIRPAITLIFLLAFTYLAIKFFWASIKLILRG